MYGKFLALCFLLFIGCRSAIPEPQSGSNVVKDASPIQTLELKSWGNGAPALQIDVPAGYAIKTQKGPDFDVHSISPVTPQNTGKAAEMGIYIGHYPSYSEKDKDVVEQQGRVGQQLVKWICWETEQQDGKLYHAETLVKGFYEPAKVASDTGSGVKKLLLHIFINGIDADQVQALRDAAQTLRLKE